MRLGESAGRLNLDSVLADCLSQHLRRHAKIQPPQEVGLSARRAKLALSLQVCDHTQQLCPQMSTGLGPHEVALELAPHTPIKDTEVWTGQRAKIPA